jgi:hypothetical protein
MTAPVRVFVNERPIAVPPGATVRDALAAADGALAAAADAGSALLTDGVGREIPATAVLGPGAIVRASIRARRSVPGSAG